MHHHIYIYTCVFIFKYVFIYIYIHLYLHAHGLEVMKDTYTPTKSHLSSFIGQSVKLLTGFSLLRTDILLMAEIRRSPVEVGSLSMFIPLFIGFQHHPRWLFEISAINSTSSQKLKRYVSSSIGGICFFLVWDIPAI